MNNGPIFTDSIRYNDTEGLYEKINVKRAVTLFSKEPCEEYYVTRWNCILKREAGDYFLHAYMRDDLGRAFWSHTEGRRQQNLWEDSVMDGDDNSVVLLSEEYISEYQLRELDQKPIFIEHAGWFCRVYDKLDDDR